MVQLADKTLRIVATRRGEVAVVRPSGPADMFQADGLRESLSNLQAEGVSVIVVDLSETDFIGSVAMSALIYGHLRAKACQGELRLAAPQPEVLNVLKAMKLTTMLAVYPSVEAALAGPVVIAGPG